MAERGEGCSIYCKKQDDLRERREDEVTAEVLLIYKTRGQDAGDSGKRMFIRAEQRIGRGYGYGRGNGNRKTKVQ